MTVFLVFIFGLLVGSFLNVLIYREVNEEDFPSGFKGVKKWLPSWFFGRSVCDHCQKKLNWYDNVPLLSYFFLKGKCRHCGQEISLQYPLVELLTGMEFVWIYFLLKGNLNFFSRFEGFYSFLTLLLWLALGSCFLAIFIADFKYQIVPDGAVVLGFLTVFFKLLVDYRYTGMVDFSVFLSSLGAALFFLALVLLTKGKGMGFGDVKLGALLGLVLGFPKILTALFFAFLTGAVVSGILVLLGKKKFKSRIAFGPFLIGGLVFALLYGEKICLFWY